MLLVVDFSDLNLDFFETDVRLDDRSDFTIGKLIDKLCDGIEELGRVKIENRYMLDLLDRHYKRIDAGLKIRDISFNDWDTVYIKRRK